MSEEQVPPPEPPPGAPPPPPPPPPPGAPPPPATPPPAAPSAGDPTQRILMIALAYLGPFALIPLLLEKKDQDVKWHAKHGLVLFGAEFVFFIPFWIISSLTSKFLGCLFLLVMLFGSFVMIAIMVFHIVCIVKGIAGERVKIPMLSDYADSFDI